MEGEISTPSTGQRYVVDATHRGMKVVLESIAATRHRSVVGCNFHRPRKSRRFHHVESHLIVYVCNCGYLSFYRDATSRHVRYGHTSDKHPIAQVDLGNMGEVAIPELPVLASNLHRRCLPDR